MKRNLFLIMFIACFVGIAIGATPVLQNSFKIKNNIGNVLAINSIVQNDPCTDPPPEDEATITPPCVDMSGGEDPPPYLEGDTHKDALPFVASQYVAKYYKENPSSGVFEYQEEKPILSYEVGGKGFTFEMPTPNQSGTNVAYFRVDIERVTSGQNVYVTNGHFQVTYPFFIPPPF